MHFEYSLGALIPIGAVFAALRLGLREIGLVGADLDYALLNWWGRLIRGLAEGRRPNSVTTGAESVATHIHVDVDAASCVAYVWLASPGAIVRFIRVELKSIPRSWGATIVVDHILGYKGTSTSALGLLPGARSILGDKFVDEVDEHDSTGRVVSPRFRLVDYRDLLGRGMSALGENSIDSHWCVVESGLSIMKAQREVAASTVSGVPTVELGGAQWAIAPPGGFDAQTGQLLSSTGITGFLYQEGNCIGVVRYSGFTTPNLSNLPSLSGWYSDPRGFMLCWGSRKNRKYTSPPAGTPQTVGELIEFLRSAWGK